MTGEVGVVTWLVGLDGVATVTTAGGVVTAAVVLRLTGGLGVLVFSGRPRERSSEAERRGVRFW